MAKVRTIAQRVLVILGAYLAALVVAGLIFMMEFFVAFPAIWPREKDLLDAVASALLLSLLTSMGAGIVVTVPATILAGFAEWRCWRSAMFHVAVGGPVGFGATIPWWRSSFSELPVLVVDGTLAGIAGAMVYWWIAGRNAGRWREALT